MILSFLELLLAYTYSTFEILRTIAYINLCSEIPRSNSPSNVSISCQIEGQIHSQIRQIAYLNSKYLVMTRDYVSCSIIVHQLQTTAKILDSSSSAATARKTSSNNITQTSFHKSYEILINNSRLLTQSYQNEVKKWQLKQYDNSILISITDINLPKFQKLINRAETSQPTTENYAKARDFYIKSLQSEMVL